MEPKTQSESRSSMSVNQPLVEIFGTKEDSEALVVQGLLDSAGIESVLVSLDAPQEILPGVGGVVLRVAPEKAEEARQLIKEYRTEAEPAPDDDAAEDVSGPAA